MLVIWQKPGQEFTHHARHPQSPPDIYTVICRWCPPGAALDSWQTVAVRIRNRMDAQDAANNACLYLIRDRQGAAEAVLVLQGEPALPILAAFLMRRDTTTPSLLLGTLSLRRI